ncbi:hypothetical protein, partial [uncultured Anaerotruncus sp.]|uniref:hypothetical protein n=1 Tax=uncultured Anaerotruncus sp. TaxID=905011 RepID=UPI0025903587
GFVLAKKEKERFKMKRSFWSGLRGSNPQPHPAKARFRGDPGTSGFKMSVEAAGSFSRKKKKNASK